MTIIISKSPAKTASTDSVGRRSVRRSILPTLEFVLAVLAGLVLTLVIALMPLAG